MNFSEYTLVSFGDSFTFGDDTSPQPDLSISQDIHSQWKKECNENSYTQVLADSLGFKNSLNFGLLGGSTERSLTLIESFLRQNPTLKIFVLFNFTSVHRFMNIFKLPDKLKYCIEDLTIGHPWVWDGRYEGVTKKSINYHYTYWRNSIQEVYLHVKERRMLYYMLSTHNVPHATFDIMNDIDYRMIRDNPIDYIDSNDGFGNNFLYNDDESYIFKEMDFLKSYHKELVDKSPLLSHIGSDYLSDSRNIIYYINRMAKDIHGDSEYYMSKDNGHWNIEGHIEVAKLIEKFIKNKYDT
jgi:hypothetical protein